MKQEIKTSIIGDDDKEIEVVANFIPGEPEVRYYRDGSGHPGSDPEIEILSAIDEDGNTRHLSCDETERAEESIAEIAADAPDEWDRDEWDD